MSEIVQLDIWQSTSGNWEVAYIKSFPKNVQNWLIPARAMNMRPDDYIKWVIDNFEPDFAYSNTDCTFVGFSWKSEARARKYKNEVNKRLRAAKFTLA